MKRSKYVQLSLAASVALAISGEVAAQEQRNFQSVEQCVDAEVAADACSNAYVAALTEHRRIAPAYDDKAKCDADFAADWCQKNSDGRFVPKLGGFKVPQNVEPAQNLDAIANAQMPAGDPAPAQTTQSTSHVSSGGGGGGGGGGGNGWLSGWLIGNAMSNNRASDTRTVYRDRDTRQTYDTSTLNRRIESAPTTRNDSDYTSSRSKSVNVASSTSRGGFGSQSSARSGLGRLGQFEQLIMKKIHCAERHDWKQTAESLGFLFHTIDDEPYWDERAYYQFTLAQIENDLEDPTTELHEMCMDLVDRVVHSEELLDRLSIPASYYDMIRTSWLEGHPHLYGRMDFSYSGNGPAKLLELNYDTPTSLYEASAFQWGWLEQCIERGMLPRHADQFNSIDTRLHEAFAQLKLKRPFYFASMKGSVEDKGTTDYLRLIAEKVGIESRHIDIEDIGLTAEGRFVDLEDRWIPHLFKLHAWEFIFHEPFGAAIAECDTQFFEPAWKSILSNKGALPLLWELHKGHPNLLAAHLDPNPGNAVPKGWVRKPYFSREGANIELQTADGLVVKEDGPYTDAPFILQEFAPLPKFDDSYTLIGSWVIGDQAAGIGVREDNSLITKDSSRFLPHLILD